MSLCSSRNLLPLATLLWACAAQPSQGPGDRPTGPGTAGTSGAGTGSGAAGVARPPVGGGGARASGMGGAAGGGSAGSDTGATGSGGVGMAGTALAGERGAAGAGAGGAGAGVPGGGMGGAGIGPGANGGGGVAGASFVPCIIDVSKVGATCSATDSTTCDGADIAQNFALWPDPYACFVCGPGVTLLKGTKCERDGVRLVWNANEQQCILNGQGYPMAKSHACSSGTYAAGVSVAEFDGLVSDWYQVATTKGVEVPQPNAGATAYVVDLVLEDGTRVQAAMSMGHGVLDGKCGDTFLVRVGQRYVVLLQTDIRSWSLELSPGANTWLDSSNVGGTCIIPEVRRIDASLVTGLLAQPAIHAAP